MKATRLQVCLRERAELQAALSVQAKCSSVRWRMSEGNPSTYACRFWNAQIANAVSRQCAARRQVDLHASYRVLTTTALRLGTTR